VFRILIRVSSKLGKEKKYRYRHFHISEHTLHVTGRVLKKKFTVSCHVLYN